MATPRPLSSVKAKKKKLKSDSSYDTHQVCIDDLTNHSGNSPTPDNNR